DDKTIDLPVTALVSFMVLLVIFISIIFPSKIKSYASLIEIILGCILYKVIFGVESNIAGEAAPFSFFPLGSLTWDTGVVLTAVLAGLLNTSNTFGSLKGTDELFESETTNKDYMTTFSITGLSTMVAGVFGL